MGILNLFKRAECPSLPSIDHPVFGRMEATLLNEDGSYFWETPEGVLTPSGPISIFLDGSIDGPSNAQVALWDWIYANSERIINSAQPLLLDRLREFGLESHVGDLVWCSAGLSPDGDRDGNWDVSCKLSASNSRFDGAILTVYFAQGVPTGVVNFDD